jgi:hypothetical protein
MEEESRNPTRVQLSVSEGNRRDHIACVDTRRQIDADIHACDSELGDRDGAAVPEGNQLRSLSQRVRQH